MSNKEFNKLYNELQTNYMKLHGMPITNLKVWFVDANGLGYVSDVESCRYFETITDRGSVVISGTLGPFLKVNDGFWVRTALSVSRKLWSDLDLVHQLINEYEDNDYIATVIDPGLE